MLTGVRSSAYWSPIGTELSPTSCSDLSLTHRTRYADVDLGNGRVGVALVRICADIILAGQCTWLGADWQDGTNPYFGVVVGRVANRIRGARYTLDGEVHTLSANQGDNMLHGGVEGWSQRKWDLKEFTDGGNQAVRCSLRSHDGDQVHLLFCEQRHVVLTRVWL